MPVIRALPYVFAAIAGLFALFNGGGLVLMNAMQVILYAACGFLAGYVLRIILTIITGNRS